MDIKDAIDILHDVINEGFTVGDRVFPVDDEERKALEKAISALEKEQLLEPYKKPDNEEIGI